MTSSGADNDLHQSWDGNLPSDRRRECYSWRTTGLCRFGNSCRYAHDGDKAYRPPDYQHRLWSHSQASTSQPDNSTKKSDVSCSFSLMSYNVLADGLALDHAKELYRAVPDWCLRWPVRVEKLIREILHWRPDIVCLQEIDHPLDFSDVLAEKGYDWKYAARTGGRSDGCLTLWRREKFDFVSSETVLMSKHSLRDNVGLIAILQLKSPSQSTTFMEQPPTQGRPVLAVANTHLIFNPKRGDIKLGQAGLILRRIAELCQEAGFTPLAVFMGDFNSTPHSAIYSFMKEGELDCYMEDRRNLSGQLESEEKGWPPRGLFTPRAPPSPAQLNQRARGSSLDDPSRSYRTQLAFPGSGYGRQPLVLTPPPGFPRESNGLQVLTQPQEKGIVHSESFTSVDEPRGKTLKAPRFSGPILPAPGQAPLYPYTDQFGQVAWSYMPPSNADIKRQPFFHEPMRVEEARPPAPPSPPPGILRTVSFAQRQINAGTWTTEQLMIATGYRPANGFVNTNANSRSQYPPPSPTEIWIAEHPLPMESTYKAVLGAEPAFTSCHGKFIGTVDYVWFTPQAGPWTLSPTAVLLPPPLESLHCGLPSPEWPSDHISLLANFTIDFHTEGIAASKSAFASEANGGAEAVKHIRFSD